MTGENTNIDEVETKTETEKENTNKIKLFLSSIEYGDEKLKPMTTLPIEEFKEEELNEINSVVKDKVDLTKKPEYIKNYIRFSKEQLKDETEIIRYEIANLLGIDIPEVNRIYAKLSEEAKAIKGILIQTAINVNNKENLMCVNFSILSQNAQLGMHKNQYPEYNVPINKNGEAITDPNTIKIIIGKGINALPSPTLEKGKERLEKDYYRMILLDLIMNQISRSGMDYSYYTSLSEEKVSDKTPYTNPNGTIEYKVSERQITVQKTTLIPGCGNYSFVNSAYSSDEYNLNDYIVSRDALLEVLLTEYKDYVNPIVSPLTDQVDRYKECISKIIYNNTSKENAAVLENIIFTNIDKVYEVSKEHNLNARIGNKVEMASTTTQQNLAILAKEEKINNKYPINPKNVEDKKEIETDQRLTLKAEPTPKEDKRAGYTSMVMLGGGLALVCGIGFAIAYIVLHMN